MGLKYFCEYRTLNTQELWRVEIDVPGYSGTPIEKMAAAEQACIIEHSGGDKLLEKFAIGSSASITLLFTDQTEVDELSLVSDKTAGVRVYRNGGTQLYWSGYLISDGQQFPDSGVAVPVTLKATDMIEAANDMPFTNTEAEAITINDDEGSTASPLNWLRKCLLSSSNIGINLPIRWSCSVKNTQYPTSDFFGGLTSLIPNYNDFASSRQQTNVLWFLENIAKSVECVLFQYGGYWYVVSLTDLAQSSTLNFYEIDGSNLDAKTATTVSINLSKTLPTSINESAFSMVQKPISKSRTTYSHSMNANIIPNGSFDQTDDGKPLYWATSDSGMLITSATPINGRTGGSSAFVNNTTSKAQSIFFTINGVNSMPFDAKVLFRDMQWGFTFSPVNFPVDGSGFIQWGVEPLKAIVRYTGYSAGLLKVFYLNRFGFWSPASSIGGMTLDSVVGDGILYTLTFSGNAVEGQIFTVSYFDTATSTPVTQFWIFSAPTPLATALAEIAANTGGSVVGGNQIQYSFIEAVENFSASLTVTDDDAPYIPFAVDGMKNNDIASLQFQSKGNQGRVLMPDPGVLDEMRALDSGKLSLSISTLLGQQFYIEDLYMNVSDNKDVWDVNDGGNDGLAEYELEISSAFSGFFTSSYMDNFAVADLSMIMDNGTDRGTLTEIFGKTALRMLSKPTAKIDIEMEGEVGMFSLLQFNSKNFLPLRTSVNTETNSTSATIFELDYNSSLLLTSAHRSSGDADNGSFSTGGYGGGSGSGGGGGGAQYLYQLGDVTFGTLIDGQSLVYDASLGKWVNAVVTPDLTPYALRDGSNSYGIWGININGSAAKWAELPRTAGNIPNPIGGILTLNDNGTNAGYTHISQLKAAINIGDGSTIANSISGNAATVTNGVYTTGSYSNPSWITSLAYSKLSGAPTALSQLTNDLGNYGNWITKAQGDTYYQPLENQRLSTTNKVAFAGVNVADFLTIPTSVSADAATNGKWQVYIDVAGTGGGGVAPPVVVNLTDLQDVAISGVTNGQALTYNSVTGKWVNSTIVTDLSNYYTKSESDARFKPIGYVPSWGDVTGKPTNFVFNDGNSYNIDVNSWNGQGYSPASENAGLTYLMGYNGTTSHWSYYNSSNVKNFLNIGDGSTLANSISGNAATVTNGVYTTGSYSNPSWITSLAWSKITGTPTTLSGYGITDAYPLTGNPSGFLTSTAAASLYEPIFSKNTAFNKNFGAASGTVAEGNDSRINNGQTAYSWGNHASAGYALSNASNINVSAYKTALGLPTSGAYDLQWVTNNGNFTNNFLKITGVNNIQNGDGLELFYDGTTSQINSYGRGTTNTPLNLGFYAAKYLFEGGNVGIGIPSPNYKLDVNGNGNFTSSLQAQRIVAGYDSGVAGSVNGLYGRFSTNLQSPIITATSQQNIPVKSGGVATGATFEIFIEL